MHDRAAALASMPLASDGAPSVAADLYVLISHQSIESLCAWLTLAANVLLPLTITHAGPMLVAAKTTHHACHQG